jgi:hypothetical protein
VADLDNWDARRVAQKAQKEKERERDKAQLRAQQKAQQMGLPPSKFAANVRPAGRAGRPAPAIVTKAVPKAARAPVAVAGKQAPRRPSAAAAPAPSSRMKQMEEFAKLKADKELLDKRIAAQQAAAAKAKKEKDLMEAAEKEKLLKEKEREREREREEAAPSPAVPPRPTQAMHKPVLLNEPLQAIPSFRGPPVHKMPSSVSAAQIARPAVAAVGKRSESVYVECERRQPAASRVLLSQRQKLPSLAQRQKLPFARAANNFLLLRERPTTSFS